MFPEVEKLGQVLRCEFCDGVVSSAKRRLNAECADQMTVSFLAVSDPSHKIAGWFHSIEPHI